MYNINVLNFLLRTLSLDELIHNYKLVRCNIERTETADILLSIFDSFCGWSSGAMVLGKLPLPGRPTNLDPSRARAYCACSRCGWGLFGNFSLVYPFSFLTPSLWETARYRLKFCLKGPLSPNQPTNQRFVLYS